MEIAYGDGFGDLGARPIFESNSSTSEENSTILISFINSNDQIVPVSGFSSSDLEILGASLTTFTELNSTHYEVIVRANQKPQRIKMRLAAGIARDDGNFSTSSASTRITYLDQITGAENLVGWWKFDSFNQDWQPDQLDNITLWLDASETDTLSPNTPNSEINQWRCKLDSSVKMVGLSGKKPQAGGSINGVHAIKFVKESTDIIDRMLLQKTGVPGSNVNPAGENHLISGKVQDVALFMVGRIDFLRKNNFSFGFGWGDHFPWSNGSVFWKIAGDPGDRETFELTQEGENYILTMYYSITEGKQQAYVDGVLLFDEPRPNDSNTANMTVFNFPPSTASGGLDADGYGSDWTVGEFIVVRGTISDEALEKLKVTYPLNGQYH